MKLNPVTDWSWETKDGKYYAELCPHSYYINLYKEGKKLPYQLANIKYCQIVVDKLEGINNV